MVIYPAIDLKEGKVVRLKQGDFQQKTVYSDDPLAVAADYAGSGAEWLHIVDLDGAKSGERKNIKLAKKIRKKTGLKIQLGGGIRSLKEINELLEVGFERLVLGTLAVKDKDAVAEAVNSHGPERIVVGLDAKNGLITSGGWQEVSQYSLLEFSELMLEVGVKYFLYTDIARDGMLTGPDLQGLAKLAELKCTEIIASGGVSSLANLKKLNEYPLNGVIIGQALYQQRFTLSEALALQSKKQEKGDLDVI